MSSQKTFVDLFNEAVADQSLKESAEGQRTFHAVLDAYFDDLESLKQDYAYLFITLFTTDFRPNHSVQVKEANTNSPRVFHGVYKEGAWRFYVPHTVANPDFVFHFVLNGETRHDGGALMARQGAPNSWKATDAGGTLAFPGASPDDCWRHDFEQIRLDESSLSQFHFPRNTDESIEYDVVVVGGGMMGGILGDVLSDRGVSTLVLEAGVGQLMTHATNLYRDTEGIFNFYQSTVSNVRGRFAGGPNIMLGGRSQFWSGVIPRILEFEKHLGWWPQEILDALFGENGSPHYYELAEATLKKLKTRGAFARSAVEYLQTRLTNHNIEVDELPCSFDLLDLNGPGDYLHPPTGIFSAADLLKDRIDPLDPGSKNLRINTGHMALEILTQNGRATAVRCYDLLTNQQRTYRGRHIVLALGNIGSPKIVQDSGLTDESGLAGKGLTDHAEWITGDPLLDPDHPLGGSQRHARLYLNKVQSEQREHPFLAEMTINTRYWAARYVDPDLWDRYTAREGRQSRVTLKFRPPVPLNDDNTVRSLGIGKRTVIDYHGYHVPFNNARGKAWEVKNAIFSALLGHSNFKDWDVDSRKDEKGTIQHSCGTLRMDSPDKSGVLDTNLRFHAYENLYCADASALPCVPTANPSLTMVALVLRLADRLSIRG
ncbi:MAG: GMC oxidoreductase [Sumerlaeia bacterium]